jgi:hypothetical protein
MFDDQIKELKAKGLATSELLLLKGLEKTRAEMFKMDKGSGVAAPAQPSKTVCFY